MTKTGWRMMLACFLILQAHAPKLEQYHGYEPYSTGLVAKKNISVNQIILKKNPNDFWDFLRFSSRFQIYCCLCLSFFRHFLVSFLGRPGSTLLLSHTTRVASSMSQWSCEVHSICWGGGGVLPSTSSAAHRQGCRVTQAFSQYEGLIHPFSPGPMCS